MFLFSSMISVSVTTFVDRIFWRTLCMWPIVVCINFGRCLRTPSAVSPGNEVSQLLLMARISVVTTGAPRVAWWNACKFDADFCLYALFAVCCICIYADRGCVLCFCYFQVV